LAPFAIRVMLRFGGWIGIGEIRLPGFVTGANVGE
jgi:hypothetical protein